MEFRAATLDDILTSMREHLASLPAAIDSFLEDHILASTHYRIVVGGEAAGFASIHGGNLVTQFALFEPYRRHGQAIFARLRRMDQVQSAFVPTCDEFYLAHALDDYRYLAKQAYFFATAQPVPAAGPYALRPAQQEDAGFVRRESGDFIEDVEQHIGRRELFVTLHGDEPVGFGVLVRSSLYVDVASVGMFTVDRFRRQGVGTATIALLIEECRRDGLRPVAGCWYYNHLSKRTLERAGMYSPTRLLKVEY